MYGLLWDVTFELANVWVENNGYCRENEFKYNVLFQLLLYFCIVLVGVGGAASVKIFASLSINAVYNKRNC